MASWKKVQFALAISLNRTTKLGKYFLKSLCLTTSVFETQGAKGTLPKVCSGVSVPLNICTAAFTVGRMFTSTPKALLFLHRLSIGTPLPVQ